MAKKKRKKETIHPVPERKQVWPLPREEHDDMCGMCWEEPLAEETLKQCVQCDRLTCDRCSDKEGRCGFCAKYDLPLNFILLDNNVGSSLRSSCGHMRGDLEPEDVPEPHVLWYDDPNMSPVVVVSCYLYPGIGLHYHTTIEEDENPVWLAIDGHWASVSVLTGSGWYTSNVKPKTPQAAKRWIKSQLVKHYGKKRRVFVLFRSPEVRQWFYKEGD